jgi:hypothetical protein
MQTLDFILLAVGNLLVFLAGVAKAGQDSLAHHFEKSVFWALHNDEYWNPVVSGNNKWKNGDKSQGEKYWQSSRALVFLTEGWHLFDMVRTKGFAVGLIMVLFVARDTTWYTFMSVGIMLMILFSSVFVIFYNKTFVLKLCKEGDFIEWTVWDHPIEGRDGKHWAKIQNVDMNRRCYGVYSEYGGMDYIPFTHCKKLKSVDIVE